MNLKEFFGNLKQFYNESLTVFEKCFDKYSFEIYEVGEYEKVYVVEDSFVVYFGIKQTRELTVINAFNQKNIVKNKYYLK